MLNLAKLVKGTFLDLCLLERLGHGEMQILHAPGKQCLRGGEDRPSVKGTRTEVSQVRGGRGQRITDAGRLLGLAEGRRGGAWQRYSGVLCCCGGGGEAGGQGNT